MRTIHKAAVAVLLSLLIAAPATASAASRAQGSNHGRSFVGTVRGTHAFVAVVVRGSHVIAYVCDSRRIAQWFRGSVRAGHPALTSKAGYELRLTVGSRQVSATVRLPGQAGAPASFRRAARDETGGGCMQEEAADRDHRDPHRLEVTNVMPDLGRVTLTG
jgi:hypothetical protein